MLNGQAPPSSAPILQAIGLGKRYGEGDTAVDAIADIDLELRPGGFTAVMGPSGSGKSTLMHLLAGLDTPSSGEVIVAGRRLAGMKDKQLTRLRRDTIGFVFQRFNLLPTLSAEENIRLPINLAGGTVDPAWFEELLTTTGLADRRTHRPAALSGGQQQRVAVARALVARPAVVFADEPTGNLDSAAGDEILRLLRHSVDELGQTVVMVTHDAHAASFADRIVVLRDGRVVHDGGGQSSEAIFDLLKSVSG